MVLVLKGRERKGKEEKKEKKRQWIFKFGNIVLRIHYGGNFIHSLPKVQTVFKC